MSDLTTDEKIFKYQQIRLIGEAMRREQKLYFATRSGSTLKRCKDLEAQFDKLLGVS